MAEETGQEKTEAATPKRIQDARKKGQIPRSRELGTFLVLLAGITAFAMFGSVMVNGLLDILENGLSPQRTQLFNEQAIFAVLSNNVIAALKLMIPMFLLLITAACMGSTILGGVAFSTTAFSFKLERLDPVKGMGRIFGWRGLMELIKSLAKIFLFISVAVLLLRHTAPAFIQLGMSEPHQGMSDMSTILLKAMLVLCSGMVVIVVIDVPFQLWEHARQLRMTRQEVRDELKETEGRPEVKGRVRQIQRELTNNRMIAAVPKADVVITNPTHYAVALRYDRQRHAAPILVAKGVDLIAMQIRLRASSSDVPIVTAPTLARAIHASTRLNHPVPAGLYLAVARILAYIYQLRTTSVDGKQPSIPGDEDLPVPQEFRT
jgi:flagellar biosynthesis protein FlhB